MSEQTTWATVNVGDVVAGGGKEWTVTAAGGGTFTISHPSRTWTGPKSGPVTVVKRRAPQGDPRVDTAVAKGLLATKFGGIEIGKSRKDRTKPWATPVEFPEPGSLLAHLRIFHAAMSDDPTLHGLGKFHATLHGPQVKADSFYEPHVHDPDYESL
jgi:hypothetical protein